MNAIVHSNQVDIVMDWKQTFQQKHMCHCSIETERDTETLRVYRLSWMSLLFRQRWQRTHWVVVFNYIPISTYEHWTADQTIKIIDRIWIVIEYVVWVKCHYSVSDDVRPEICHSWIVLIFCIYLWFICIINSSRVGTLDSCEVWTVAHVCVRPIQANEVAHVLFTWIALLWWYGLVVRTMHVLDIKFVRLLCTTWKHRKPHQIWNDVRALYIVYKTSRIFRNLPIFKTDDSLIIRHLQ